MKKDECYASGSEVSSYYHYEFLAKRAYIPKQKWN